MKCLPFHKREGSDERQEYAQDNKYSRNFHLLLLGLGYLESNRTVAAIV